MSIFRLYEVVESVHNLYLAMEYAHGGELFARLTGDKGPYREKPDAKVIFAQIASAIDYMHQNFFIHRSEMRICPPRPPSYLTLPLPNKSDTHGLSSIILWITN